MSLINLVLRPESSKGPEAANPAGSMSSPSSVVGPLATQALSSHHSLAFTASKPVVNQFQLEDPSLPQMVKFIAELGANLLTDPTLKPNESTMVSPVGVMQILTMLLCGMTSRDDQIKMLAKMNLVKEVSPQGDNQADVKLSAATTSMAATPQQIAFKLLDKVSDSEVYEICKKAAQVQKKIMDNVVRNGLQEPFVSSSVAMAITKPVRVDANGQLAANFEPQYIQEIVKGLFKGDVFAAEDIQPIKAWILNQIKDRELQASMSRLIDQSLAQDIKSASAALIHVLFFKAFWEQTFTEDNTKPMDVLGIDGTWTQNIVMSKEMYANTYVGEGYTLVQLPYKLGSDDDNQLPLSYVIAIPHDHTKIDDLVKRLPHLLSQEQDRFISSRKIYIQLPKQNFEESIDLLEPLIRQGFPVKAFLDRIGYMKQVQKMKQQLTGKLDQNGTKFAAKTYATMGTGCCMRLEEPTPLLVDCRRPFIGCVASASVNGGEVPLLVTKMVNSKYFEAAPQPRPRAKIDYEVNSINAESAAKMLSDVRWKAMLQNAQVAGDVGAKKVIDCRKFKVEGDQTVTIVNYTKRNIKLALRGEVLIDGTAQLREEKFNNVSKVVLQTVRIMTGNCVLVEEGQNLKLYHQTSDELFVYHLDCAKTIRSKISL